MFVALLGFLARISIKSKKALGILKAFFIIGELVVSLQARSGADVG